MDVLERIKRLEEEHKKLVEYLEAIDVIRQSPALGEGWVKRDITENELRRIVFSLEHSEAFDENGKLKSAI